MQVAALMFPSLFMAQHSTSNNNQQGSSSSLLAQQSFLQNLQVQQQINDQQLKLFESLGASQSNNHQSSDWPKILNGQAKTNNVTTSTTNKSSHNSNGSGSNYRQATIIQNNKVSMNLYILKKRSQQGKRRKKLSFKDDALLLKFDLKSVKLNA